MTVTLELDAVDARALWHAACTTVQLIDAVEAEPGNSIPSHAPLYGQRDRLVTVARRLDHECNQAERAVGPSTQSDRCVVTTSTTPAPFAGSPITGWCARCDEYAVPMRDGTCGFCGRQLTHQSPPLDLGGHPRV